MRISFLILLTVTFCGLLRAQAPADVVAPEDAGYSAVFAKRAVPVVTGRLLNMPAEELDKLVITYTLVTPFSETQVKKTTKPGRDGGFRLELDYPFTYQQIWFQAGDYFYAGLYANTDLFVELDMDKIKAAKEVNWYGDGVRYLGTDGALNLYMNRYILYRRDEQLALSQRANMLMMSRAGGDTLVARIDSIFGDWKRIVDDFGAANPSPYRWILENEEQSDHYSAILIHYFGKTMNEALWSKIKQHKGYLMSNSSCFFYNYLAMYLGSHPGNVIQREDSLLSPGKADLLKLRAAPSTDLAEQKTGLAAVIPTMHTQWCIDVAKAQYDEKVRSLAAINKTLAESAGRTDYPGLGKPLLETAFGARMYKADGMKALDLLARLKQSFPGKAIIIDRWATWCAPCLGEMPHSKELEQSAGDLPVVFVYLCTLNNSSEDKWKSKVIQLEQPGIHILIDETQDAELSHYFSFSGYPGYAFLDKSGSYRPGVFHWMSEVKDREALAVLVNK